MKTGLFIRISGMTLIAAFDMPVARPRSAGAGDACALRRL